MEPGRCLLILSCIHTGSNTIFAGFIPNIDKECQCSQLSDLRDYKLLIHLPPQLRTGHCEPRRFLVRFLLC